MGLVRWDRRTENGWRVFKGHCNRCGGGKVACPVGQVGEYNQEADHSANFDAEWRRERRQYRQLDGGTMNLGREQQDRQKKWMWCCGQRCVQKQVDHNQ